MSSGGRRSAGRFGGIEDGARQAQNVEELWSFTLTDESLPGADDYVDRLDMIQLHSSCHES